MSDKRCKYYHERGGQGLDGWIMPCCECGWKGHKHHAHNDYQFSNACEEWERHFADKQKKALGVQE